MSKSKILMVSCEGLGRGGVQAVMMCFVRDLSKFYTFDVMLFTNDIRYYDEEFLTYGGKIIRIPHYAGKYRLRKKIDYYVRGLGLYLKVKKALIKNGPYQAIHCHNEYESAICLCAAKSVGVPIRICHSHTVCSSSNILAMVVNGIYTRLINKYSTNKIGCSQSACEALYGKNAGGSVLNNPYDDEKFNPHKYEKVEKSVFSITQVGRYDDNKNQLFSLKVLKALTEKRKDIRLNLVGFGSENYITFLKEKAKELQIDESVAFIDGNSADIPLILSQSDVFLFPSKKEGFGITLIEAQAMGLTCYVSDTVPKTTNVGGCVYLSLNDEPEKWASEILRNNFQKNKYDCSEFSLSKVVKQMNSMYDQKA